jgi:hypothetical protein
VVLGRLGVTLCDREIEEQQVPQLSWQAMSNKVATCAEFAAVHENFAWRKHHASRFGLLKKQKAKCANDSLSRAFRSAEDSVLQLFSPEGNRTLRDHPKYGQPKFAVVWYEGEDWAILCAPNEATLIESSRISQLPRKENGAAERIRMMQELWRASDPALRIPLDQVLQRIA